MLSKLTLKTQWILLVVYLFVLGGALLTASSQLTDLNPKNMNLLFIFHLVGVAAIFFYIPTPTTREEKMVPAMFFVSFAAAILVVIMLLMTKNSIVESGIYGLFAFFLVLLPGLYSILYLWKRSAKG